MSREYRVIVDALDHAGATAPLLQFDAMDESERIAVLDHLEADLISNGRDPDLDPQYVYGVMVGEVRRAYAAGLSHGSKLNTVV